MPVFNAEKGKKWQWAQALAKENHRFSFMAPKPVKENVFGNVYDEVYDPSSGDVFFVNPSPDKTGIRVNVSGREFHRIGLKYDLVKPIGKRDKKYLARLKKEKEEKEAADRLKAQEERAFQEVSEQLRAAPYDPMLRLAFTMLNNR